MFWVRFLVDVRGSEEGREQVSNKHDDGGPAFPLAPPALKLGEYAITTPGMSLRDWFAGQVLCGWVSDQTVVANNKREAAAIAQSVYLVADAMLAERAKKGEEK